MEPRVGQILTVFRSRLTTADADRYYESYSIQVGVVDHAGHFTR